MRKYFLTTLVLSLIVLPGIIFAQSDSMDPDPIPAQFNNNLVPFQQAVSQNPSTYSQCYTDMDNLGDMICRIGELLNSIIPVLLALGVVYFVFGVVQYVIGSDEEAKTKGKDRIIYGLIGFVVILSLWGLVYLVIRTFGISQETPNVNLTNFKVQENSQPGDSAIFCSLGNNPKLQTLLGFATCVITKSVIPLIFALAVAGFVWGIVQYVILGADSDEKRAQGRQFMIWGIIALTVMICVWGLVKIVASTFNIDNVIPQVKGK